MVRSNLLFFILSTSLLALSFPLEAQRMLPLGNSIDSIRAGLSDADTGGYKNACQIYEHISRNDTNYDIALLEDAISRESNGEDSMAIVLCKKGLALETDYAPDFYSTLATAYIDMGSSSDAIKMLRDEAIPKYANYHTLYYTLGLAHYKLKQYDEAITSFEKAIDLDIYDANSHYYLGRCCLEQGRIIPALLSLQFYLILQPATNRSYTTVGLIDEIVQNKYQFNNSSQWSGVSGQSNDSIFDELDALIRSKIAFNKQYKPQTKISYNMVKQEQLLLEKLQYIPNTGNYWMEKYVPFFTQIQTKKFLEPYCYYLLSSVGDESLQKAIKKNKGEIKAFEKWAQTTLSATRRNSGKWSVVSDKSKPSTDLVCYYYDNNMLRATGMEDKKGKSTGDWTFYNSRNGLVSTRGRFNETDEREGKWQWFYNSGQPKETTNYINGKRDGSSEQWYANGSPKAKYTYHNDQLDGDFWEYNNSGILTTRGTYKANKLDGGITLFYDDGNQHYTGNYMPAGTDGDLKEYYVTGQLKDVIPFLSNLKNGTMTKYYSNGKIEEQGDYKNDKETGVWKSYYSDGSLLREGTYGQDGNPAGNWITYFRNGQKSETVPFGKMNKITGPDSLFDDDGKLYGVIIYNEDNLLRYSYTDKSGNVVVEDKLKGKDIHYESHFPDGAKSSEGVLVNNKKEGEWKFYSEFGTIVKQENYLHNSLNGMMIDYYINGKVKDSVNYTNDNEDGYYISYYLNGAVKSEGWMVNGQAEGDWNFYDLRGNIMEHKYLINGELSGYTEYYNPTGRLTEEIYYHYGYPDKIFVYDSTGKNITYKYVSKKGTGQYLSTYPNGKTRTELNYVAGNTEGTERKYYYNGKLANQSDYLLDNRQGEYKSYHNNGSIEGIYNYDAGNLEGTAYGYYKNGNLESQYNYLDGNLDGDFTQYYANGHISGKGHCANDDYEGEYKIYGNDSILAADLWFHHGIITGFSYYDPQGKLASTPLPVKDGTGEITIVYPNGKTSFTCKYVNGYLQGPRIIYNVDGKISSEENYESGVKNGIQKYYYPDGTIESEESYYYGEKDGVFKYYYKDGKLEHQENWILGIQQGAETFYDESGKLLKNAIWYDGDEVSESSY